MGPCLRVSLEEGHQCWAFLAVEGGNLVAVHSTA